MKILTEAAVSLRGATGSALRWSRRARGWRVDRYEDFVTQVRLAAASIEKHPQLVSLWRFGRMARIQTLNAKMQEHLVRACGDAVIVDCMTDELGAIGEAHMGYWIADFRIEIDPRRRSLGRPL